MNDRFKFRAWDKINKFFVFATLYPRVEIPFEATNLPPKGKKWSLKAPTELNWQQCTGLKDKNGKLIFEGDIIRHHLWYENYEIVEVEYSIPVTGFLPFVEWNSAPTRPEMIEIIGNVWENPDLLTQPEK